MKNERWTCEERGVFITVAFLLLALILLLIRGLVR